MSYSVVRRLRRGCNGGHDSALQEHGAVEGELKRLEELEAGMPAEQNALLAAQEAQGLYEELQSAFGRQGVQAMLIDTLLPKVEDTANELLARMTDGRMHVKLETQRERKGGQGGTIETLDIAISDELGARPYELFSGGRGIPHQPCATHCLIQGTSPPERRPRCPRSLSMRGLAPKTLPAGTVFWMLWAPFKGTSKRFL